VEEEEYATTIKLVEEAHKLMNDKKYKISRETVLRDENKRLIIWRVLQTH
jgi:hypothetical protein